MKQLIILALLLVTLVIPVSVQAVTFDGGASTTGTLILDNKDIAWQRITDGKYGVFTYNSSGDTLDYTLAVTGLGATPTAYSLIYFADPYPGDKPGALIWSGTSTSTGRIDATSSIDLGMDLPTAPDSNMLLSHAGAPDFYNTPTGAKIWLIPTAYYNATTKSVTAWNPTVTSSILFETDLIIYTDTNKPLPAGTPLTTTVTVPPAILSLGVSPVEGLTFGSVNIGSCSTAGANIITLTNTGTVPIIVTAVPTAGFYANSLKFGGILATDWASAKMESGATLALDAQVCPLPGVTGTITGSVAFIATFAP